MVASLPNQHPLFLVALATVATITVAAPELCRADTARPSHHIAVMTDVGVPDGFMAGVLARLSPRSRVHFGVGHNALAMGIRGGVRLHASAGTTSPFIAVEAGHYFNGAAQPWLRAMVSNIGPQGVELTSLSYRFYNASVGLRVGDSTMALYFQVGASFINGDLHVRETQASPAAMAPSVDVFSRTTLQVWSPAGRVGLIAFF